MKHAAYSLAGRSRSDRGASSRRSRRPMPTAQRPRHRRPATHRARIRGPDGGRVSGAAKGAAAGAAVGAVQNNQHGTGSGALKDANQRIQAKNGAAVGMAAAGSAKSPGPQAGQRQPGRLAEELRQLRRAEVIERTSVKVQ